MSTIGWREFFIYLVIAITAVIILDVADIVPSFKAGLAVAVLVFLAIQLGYLTLPDAYKTALTVAFVAWLIVKFLMPIAFRTLPLSLQYALGSRSTKAAILLAEQWQAPGANSDRMILAYCTREEIRLNDVELGGILLKLYETGDSGRPGLNNPERLGEEAKLRLRRDEIIEWRKHCFRDPMQDPERTKSAGKGSRDWSKWNLYPNNRFILTLTLVGLVLGIALYQSQGQLNYIRWLGGGLILGVFVYLVIGFFDQDLNPVLPPTTTIKVSVGESVDKPEVGKTPGTSTTSKAPAASATASEMASTWLKSGLNGSWWQVYPFYPLLGFINELGFGALVSVILILLLGFLVWAFFQNLGTSLPSIAWLFTWIGFAMVILYIVQLGLYVHDHPGAFGGDGRRVVANASKATSSLRRIPNTAPECQAISWAGKTWSGSLECEANYPDTYNVVWLEKNCQADGAADFHVDASTNYWHTNPETPDDAARNGWLQSFKRSRECKQIVIDMNNRSGGVLRSVWMHLDELKYYKLELPEGLQARILKPDRSMQPMENGHIVDEDDAMVQIIALPHVKQKLVIDRLL